MICHLYEDKVIQTDIIVEILQEHPLIKNVYSLNDALVVEYESNEDKLAFALKYGDNTQGVIDAFNEMVS